MPAQISPVYAPKLFSLMFWAARRMFESRISLDTSPKAVNGGAITTSTSLTPARSRLRSATSASASATVLFIFQLPAMINLRSFFMFKSVLFLAQRRHARQDRAFQKFQARAAAGAHESHLVTQAGLVQRLHAVAATNDALGPVLLRGFHHSLRHGIGAGGKTRVFKHAHWPVPQDGLGATDDCRVSLFRFCADAETLRIVRD